MLFSRKRSPGLVFWTVLILLTSACLSLALADGSGTCGEDLTWKLSTKGVLTVSGRGEMDLSLSYEKSWSKLSDEIKKVVVRKGVTSVCESAFRDCKNLTEVVLPDGLKRIGKYAFSNCWNLKRITIPDSVGEIREWFGTVHHDFYIQCGPGSYAESYARRNGISFHNQNCSTFGFEITNVSQKADWIIATYIRPGMSEYQKAAVLHDWIVHNAVYDFSVSGNSAAHILINGRGVCGCYSLAYSLLLGKVGIESQYITGSVFDPNDHGWSFVRIDGKWYHVDVTWDDKDIDTSIRSYFLVGDKVMEGSRKWDHTRFHTDELLSEIIVEGIIYRLGDTTATIIGLEDTKAGVLTLPNIVEANGKEYRVSGIQNGAFKNKTRIESVSLGSSIQTIGKNAFAGCSRLKTVSRGNGVRTIGDAAFSGCTSLKAITLNSQVQSIGKKAFYGCKKLATVTIITRRLTNAKVGASAFKGISAKAKIICPKSVLKKYKKFLLKKGITKKMTIVGE